MGLQWRWVSSTIQQTYDSHVVNQGSPQFVREPYVIGQDQIWIKVS